MKKKVFREPQALKFENQGMQLDEEKQLECFTEIRNELIKFVYEQRSKEGMTRVLTDGNYKLANLEFVEGKILESEESEYMEFKLVSFPNKDIHELDSVILIFWELLWMENQMKNKFKSYLHISKTDNYLKFRSKHENN